MSCLRHSWLALAALFATSQGKSFWASSPANHSNIIKEAYPLGNGRLGVMPFGKAGAEKLNLNLDSLWSGGPFAFSNYTGGNPLSERNSYLPGIREWIFQNGTGNVSQLLYTDFGYGSYQVLGNLSVEIQGINGSSGYRRSLDLNTGVHSTSFASSGKSYTTTVYCSYPDQVCIYHLDSDHTLPQTTISLENQLVDPKTLDQTCTNSYIHLTGYTQLGPPLGMKYDAIVRVASTGVNITCSGTQNSALVVSPSNATKSVTFVFGAGTDYDQTKGNAASNYSFRGEDPGPYVETATSKAAAKSYETLLERHIEDYSSYTDRFEFDLPDPNGSEGLETSVIIGRYNYTGGGDPYVESLLFDYARHLFISSSRDNSLPTNLQGRWTEQLTPAWSADYHSNINIQMNHWATDQIGLGGLQSPLWDYMEDTWVPRGTETARILYGAPGFVVHNEENIFGHTGMKTSAEWANYPAAAAWMMQHVWDHFDYSQDVDWLKKQGYPLLKGVAAFWLSQLQQDKYTNDGSLVVNPCNSPEHGPTTFGCTHFQQLIHQVFEAILSSAPLVQETDSLFVQNISSTLSALDKGLHIGTWNQIKEWKLPESFGFEEPNNTHRHLSHLVGWYPGYSLSSFQSGYTNATIQSAISTSLISRGLGTGSDADAGWAKVWRAACWARLNNTEMADLELRYAIDTNFAQNGLSMYWALSTPFQIDANYGLAGAVLSMLVTDLPRAYGSEGTRTVVLGPAIPSRWAGGRVKGLKVRGGGEVDFEWDGDGIVQTASLKGMSTPLRVVNKLGKLLAEI